MSESSFERDILPVVLAIAVRVFARHPDRDALVADMVSEAWLGYVARPDQTAGQYAWYARHRATCGRQFRESARSVTGPNLRGIARPERKATLPPIFRERDNPARIVEFRLDFAGWLEQLPPRRRAIAEMLALGYTSREVADAFGVTEGAISQHRRRLAENWAAYRSH